MIGTRVVVVGVLLAGCVASACTAIVGAKLSDTSDYGTADTPTAPGACALIQEGDANTCSTCIQTKCSDEVAYACNGGIQEKQWFSELQNCAQNPEVTSSLEWGCEPYQKLEPVASDPGSDTQQEELAHNCVTNNCLAGATPDCKRCDVQIQKSSADPTYAQLSDDACGQCIVQNCYTQLLNCCSTAPIADFIEKCAYTALPTNKTTCVSLANPDAGSVDTSEYDDAGTQCLGSLSQCFQQNCAQTPGCQ